MNEGPKTLRVWWNPWCEAHGCEGPTVCVDVDQAVPTGVVQGSAAEHGANGLR